MIGDVLLRLTFAAVAGALVGIQAQSRWRPGGFRTHTLTTVGAALFCIVASQTASGGDELRGLHGITQGVGFIGAATVLREGTSVRGITTAASIWASAALGCAVGYGYWRIAVPAAGFLAIVNALANLIEQKILSHGQQASRHGPPSGEG